MHENSEKVDLKVFDEELNALPGGTSLHPAVLRGMLREYVNPWSSEFVAFFEETLGLLKSLYDTKQDVLVMIGPIRLAMDAVVCSILGHDKRTAVVVDHGYWSHLFTEIMQGHGITPFVIEETWGLPINPKKLAEQLDSMQNENIKALFVTHVETSTGVVNDVEQIGQIARDRGLLFIVDAAQSLGGIEVHMDDWGIDFCISGNHKCMSTPSGLSYVGISRNGWNAIENRKSDIKGWYNNLLVWREIWMKRQSGYFTFPTSLVFGLRAALDQMFDMSLSELYRRYRVVAKAIRYAVSVMGLELVISGHDCPGCDSPAKFCADTVTAIRYPPNIRHEDFARLMHSKYNISIGGTYGPLAGKAFRLGPTGLLQIKRGFTLNVLSCMSMAFQQLGFQNDANRALRVADSIMAGL